MDTGSVLSEPVNYPHLRGFPKERSTSMTILSPKPRMSQLENLEAKMANIEVSLSSSANSGRRRKGSSLGSPSIINGNGSTRASPRPGETKELRSALQDREAVIQNLRIQLGLGKLPRPTGPPLDDTEKPAAEQKIARLKIDAENKRIAIRNLKSALDKLDITDNIDIRIRQAELEYALGREELQLLSIVEEARALQTRLDKSKPESNSLYSIITSGVNLSLHAVNATTGRWAAITKSESYGLFIEWALDGEGLLRGDRILEVNGKLITCKTKEELQKIVGTSGKCQLVIIRKKSLALPQQQLLQQQEDNQRLQHRISYLEEQVRELQNSKETSSPPPLPSPSTHPTATAVAVAKRNNNKQQNNSNLNGNRSPVESITSSLSSMSSASSNNGCIQPGNATTTNGHVTSINISSPAALTPTTTMSGTTNTTNLKSSATNSALDKPLIYQRGNYVTTLLGGKPIELTGNLSTINSNSLTKSTATTATTKTTAINTRSDLNTPTSKTSSSQINQQNIGNSNNNNHSHHHHHHHHHHITKTLIHENGYSDRSHTDTETSYMPPKSLSASKISINSDVPLTQYQHHYHHHNQYNGSSSTGRKRYTERSLLRNGKISSEVANQLFNQQHHQQQNIINGINHINGLNHDNNNENMHARSVEHLNYNGIDRRKDIIRSEHIRKFGNDLRSVKSLDFESDTNDGHSNHTSHIYSKRNVDYTSEPVAPRVRPTPPKKPLRLSLQRAQSLQTVEVIPGNDADKKRPLKRAHNSEKANDAQIIETSSPLHTASLGRHKHI